MRKQSFAIILSSFAASADIPAPHVILKALNDHNDDTAKALDALRAEQAKSKK